MTQELKSNDKILSSSKPIISYKKLVQAKGDWQAPLAAKLTTRHFTFFTDEPQAIGGKDEAPTPMELVAGAINGCVTVVLATVANELGVKLYSIKTESNAHIDTRGFLGIAEVSPHFTDYRLDIEIVTDGCEEALTTLKKETAKRCPAVNLILDAKVDVNISWTIKTPEEVAL